MLTDEEIKEIRNRATLNDNRQIEPMPFARDIERAVMKRMGEQEPVAFCRHGGLDKEDFVAITESHFMHEVALYAHPLPAQAVPAKQYDIDLIHRAARHLEVVMDEHPYCDHVQVVKHFADIRLNERSISAAPKP